jgi:hypothetical protein
MMRIRHTLTILASLGPVVATLVGASPVMAATGSACLVNGSATISPGLGRYRGLTS